MHFKRLVVALILLPVFYLYIMKLPPLFFMLLLLGASVAAQIEFYAMYRLQGIMRNAGILAGILLVATLYFYKELMPDLLLCLVIIILSIRLLSRKGPSSALQDTAPVVLALLYIPGLLGFQIFLRGAGPGWIIFLYGSIWASDSLAFYIGKTLGRAKLYKEVSPNKTVAGAFGSLLGGALSGVLLNYLLLHTMSLWQAVLIGLIIGATAIISDLVESMFKRDAGVKDSSSLIPGHGGVLDKLDGALFTGPVFYWTSKALGLII